MSGTMASPLGESREPTESRVLCSFLSSKEAPQDDTFPCQGSIPAPSLRAPKQPGPHLSRRLRKNWQSQAYACNTLTKCFPYYPISSPLPLYLIMTTDSKFDAADTGNQRCRQTEGETAFVNHRALNLQGTDKTTDSQMGRRVATLPVHFTKGIRWGLYLFFSVL